VNKLARAFVKESWLNVEYRYQQLIQNSKANIFFFKQKMGYREVSIKGYIKRKKKKVQRRGGTKTKTLHKNKRKPRQIERKKSKLIRRTTGSTHLKSFARL